ncbi:NtaA/DmoA family FMN-dependent monooxygenase [Microbacterium sp. X-17]|uniref:NtaA/DmoA family FMN-dependent monooxygenase n=1 Tax=Microbacterium sp. X-17 TaxID=3144404 RepID=UPI0031F4DB54
MKRRLVTGVFDRYSQSHHFLGTWRMPGSTGNRGYADIETWVELAKLAEAAKLDFLMLADGMGEGGYFPDDWKVPLEEGMLGTMDPSILMAALSRETTDLGLVATTSVVQDHPFHFARRMSTLDHITSGRVGWNVVTSFVPGMWRNFGLPDLDHDERYVWAEEYMEVVYALWEGSWERDAVVRSIAENRWVDAAKVHTIDHVGERYRVQGPHMVEPSPQGSPLIFQAGMSEAGSHFAARHAEVQFIGDGADPARAGAYVARMRELVASNGRDPESILFAPALSLVVGETDEDARRKSAAITENLSFRGLAGKLNSHIGFDLSAVGSEVDIDALTTEGVRSLLDTLRQAFPPGYKPSLDELLRVREASQIIAGTPERIADHIEELYDNGVEGVMVMGIPRPTALRDFVEGVVPELQKRGLMQTEYAKGTLREKLFGDGALLRDDHPGATYRARVRHPDA